MADAELCFQTIEELSPRLRAGEVSPVDVVDALLQRIEQYNERLLGYLHVDAESARVAAKAAESEIVAGGYRGPLHGIPVAYKDIYDVQGLPTTAGSRLMAGYVASEDCTVAARFRQAGAICIGKLNTIEFASGSMDVYGTARNPWHTDRFPGGSSSGSGTALAAPAGARGDGERYRRFGPESRVFVRDRGVETYVWADQPSRDCALELEFRSCWPHGPDRC